ncbi:Hypothetical predicted protein [Olea europaea subsp. europaea]|uniref:Uncharacterized protein n=1 Tax=Olea europaea subsp. europaea TaxID=158383 RepID=A0A8S0PQX0_OLEEU|nr:Hypothetical predicted protein [Olea europaea subsp. europaea]
MNTRSKTLEEQVKRIKKELGDLSVVCQITNQAMKHLYSRQDKLESLMMEMNSKYENIVGMMAKMNGWTLNSGAGNSSTQANGKGIQIEGHPSPALSSAGLLSPGIGNSPTQGSGMFDY